MNTRMQCIRGIQRVSMGICEDYGGENINSKMKREQMCLYVNRGLTSSKIEKVR